MGAYVVFDPYWDPIYGYATEEEAKAASDGDGAHYIWMDDAVPGDCSDLATSPKPWD